MQVKGFHEVEVHDMSVLSPVKVEEAQCRRGGVEQCRPVGEREAMLTLGTQLRGRAEGERVGELI